MFLTHRGSPQSVTDLCLSDFRMSKRFCTMTNMAAREMVSSNFPDMDHVEREKKVQTCMQVILAHFVANATLEVDETELVYDERVAQQSSSVPVNWKQERDITPAERDAIHSLMSFAKTNASTFSLATVSTLSTD